MADAAMMYCPFCRMQGSPAVQLMRDNVDMFCMMGHRGSHAQIMGMHPDMIKTTVLFKPGPNDIKVEIWCNQEVYLKAKETLGERFHPTMAAVIRMCMAGDPVLIDGQQAAELRKLGIKNGAEMLAAAKQNVELCGQNQVMSDKLIEWEQRVAGALARAD